MFAEKRSTKPGRLPDIVEEIGEKRIIGRQVFLFE
jgi:hypothetical protein